MSQGIIRTDRPDKIDRVFKGEVDDVSKSKRTVTSIVTTDCIDRYREVIVAKGIKLDNFRANPVVLWCHCSTYVIGKNLWVKRFTKDGKSGLIAKTLFAKTDLAEEVFQLYSDGFLNGWSIGCNPDWATYSQPTDEELKGRPDWKKARALIRNCELCEYSAVSIPANPEALGNEMEKRFTATIIKAMKEAQPWAEILEDEEQLTPQTNKQAELPELPPALPPLVGRTFEQAMEQRRAAVARLTGTGAAKAAALEQIDRLKGRV